MMSEIGSSNETPGFRGKNPGGTDLPDHEEKAAVCPVEMIPSRGKKRAPGITPGPITLSTPRV